MFHANIRNNTSILKMLSHLLRLGERLGSHSQLGKQRALAKLVADFLQQKLPSQQLDQHHNLLSLVFWLARRPLESAYIPAVPQQDIRIGQHMLPSFHFIL